MAVKTLIGWDADTKQLCAIRVRMAQDVTATEPLTPEDLASMRAFLGSNGTTSVQNPDTGLWHTVTVSGAAGEEQVGLSEGSETIL